MADKKADDVSTTSSAYDRMLPDWQKMDALLGGTSAMRAAGEAYLPRHTEEDPDQYSRRLMSTTLLNMTKITAEQLTGRVFAEPPQLMEANAQIEELAKNIDGQGNDLATFLMRWFDEGLKKAFSHVMVDFPSAPVNAETGLPEQLTVEQEKNLGRRPYWVRIPPENVIFAYGVTGPDGRERLQHVRILEQETVLDGYAEAIVTRIRVLEPGRWQLWRLAKKDEWVLESEGTTTLSEIPLVTFYAGPREGVHLAPLPLIDLADLNIAHWQSSSDQRNVLTVSRFPMLAVSGALEEDEAGVTKLKVGPNQWLQTKDPTGKFYYVEHQGAAIAAGAADLEKLENQMANYGAEFLRSKPGSQTATARALDSAESMSQLAAMARVFKSSVEVALGLTCQWLGIDVTEGGTLTLVEDLTHAGNNEEVDLGALQKARDGRDLSRRTYLSELQRRGVIDEDIDLDDEIAALQQENEDALAAMPGLDPNADPAEEPTDPNADPMAGGGM